MENMTYKVAMWGAGRLNTLKPVGALGSVEYQVLPNIYETLYMQTGDGAFVSPFVSDTQWDQHTRTLRIRLKSRRFHDGREVRAEDVRYSLIQGFKQPHRLSNNSWQSSGLSLGPDRIVVEDEKTLVIKLSEAGRRPFILEVCKLPFSIRPNNSDALDDIIGTGPYYLDQMGQGGTFINLARCKNHPESVRAFAHLAFIGHADQQQVKNAFRNGDVHEVTHFGHINSLEEDLKPLAVKNNFQFVSVLQLNCKSELFKEFSRRQQFSKMASLCVQNMDKTHRFLPSTGIIPNGYMGHRQKPLIQAVSQNWAEGYLSKPVRIGVTSSRQKVEVQKVFSEKFLQFYNLKIQFVHIPSFDRILEFVESNQVDAVYVSLKVDHQNCRNVISIFDSGHPKNFMQFHDPEVDRWIQSIERSKTRAVELEKFKKIEEIVLKRFYCVPFGYLQTHQLRRTHLFIHSDLWEQSGKYLKVKEREVAGQLHRNKFEIQQLQNQVQELMQYKKIYSTIEQLSHDIRSPLSALVVANKNRGKNSEAKALVESASSRISGIIEELKGEVDKVRSYQEFTSFVDPVDPEFSPVELKSVFNFSDFVVQLLAEKSEEFKPIQNIEIKVHMGQHLQDLVCMDKQLMARALSNLLNNSAEAKGEDPLVISIEFYNDGDNLICEIIDNGKGIPPEQLPHIFKRGYSTKNSDQLCGLGLWQAQSAMDLSGGSLHVSSSPGYGTTVRMAIPITRINSAPPQVAPNESIT